MKTIVTPNAFNTEQFDVGVDGKVNAKFVAGPKGDTGPQGPKGDKGDAGEAAASGMTEKEINDATVIWWAVMAERYSTGRAESGSFWGTTHEEALAKHLTMPHRMAHFASVAFGQFHTGGTSREQFDILFGPDARWDESPLRIAEAYYRWLVGMEDLQSVENARKAIPTSYPESLEFLDWAGLTPPTWPFPFPYPEVITPVPYIRLSNNDPWVREVAQAPALHLAIQDSYGAPTDILDFSNGKAYLIDISGSGGDATNFGLEFYNTSHTSDGILEEGTAMARLPTWINTNNYPSGRLQVVLYAWEGYLVAYLSDENGKFTYKGAGDISIIQQAMPMESTYPQMKVRLVMLNYWANLVTNGTMNS